MKTSARCLPCFRRQAEGVLHRAGLAPEAARPAMAAVEAWLAQVQPQLSPPENAASLYRLLAAILHDPDPFRTMKKAANRLALDLLPRLQRMMPVQGDRLAAAVRLAIAGNVIDCGAPHSLKLDRVLASCLARPLAVDHLERLRHGLTTADRVLFLGDNAGEVAFDRLLLEELPAPSTYVVRSVPVINDALKEDALACGLHRRAALTTSGCDCPGTVLARCRPAFRQIFAQAPLVISKGQGNFETLSDVPAPVVFLFTVKCPVVAEHLGQLTGLAPEEGDMVVLAHPRWDWDQGQALDKTGAA
ncbi:MAG: ARMT1-like domain-containing protein [Thermodesulfobacteriota bacterium]